MKQVNAMDIQCALKGLKTVSVPWIQTEYELTYQEAKMFLGLLAARGWIKKEPDGILYEINKDNLCLRKIERKEVNKLIEDITSDCLSALNCLRRKAITGASTDDLIAEVRGEDDTKAALKVLTNLALVYCYDGMYFPRVSQATIRILTKAIRMKRTGDAQNRLSGETQNTKEIIKLFDELFESTE